MSCQNSSQKKYIVKPFCDEEFIKKCMLKVVDVVFIEERSYLQESACLQGLLLDELKKCSFKIFGKIWSTIALRLTKALI